MKTKFIKVDVSDELPQLKDDSVAVLFENGSLECVHIEEYFGDIGNGIIDGMQQYTKWYLSESHPKITHWLKEVYDHEAELVERLKSSTETIQWYMDNSTSENAELFFNIGMNEIMQNESLIQKVKP